MDSFWKTPSPVPHIPVVELEKIYSDIKIHTPILAMWTARWAHDVDQEKNLISVFPPKQHFLLFSHRGQGVVNWFNIGCWISCLKRNLYSHWPLSQCWLGLGTGETNDWQSQTESDRDLWARDDCNFPHWLIGQWAVACFGMICFFYNCKDALRSSCLCSLNLTDNIRANVCQWMKGSNPNTKMK